MSRNMSICQQPCLRILCEFLSVTDTWGGSSYIMSLAVPETPINLCTVKIECGAKVRSCLQEVGEMSRRGQACYHRYAFALHLTRLPQDLNIHGFPGRQFGDIAYGSVSDIAYGSVSDIAYGSTLTYAKEIGIRTGVKVSQTK